MKNLFLKIEPRKARPTTLWKMRGNILSKTVLGASNSQELIELLANARLRNGLRASCAWVLGMIGDKHALPALTSGLQADNKALIWECALAIAKIPGPMAERVLMTELKRSVNPQRRMAAISALGNIPSKKSVPHLVKILRDQRLPSRMRGEAADALGKIGNKEAVKPLLDATYDKSSEVRFWAVYALGQTGDTNALGRLRELARSDHAKLKQWGSISREAKDAEKQIMLAYRHAPARRQSTTKPAT